MKYIDLLGKHLKHDLLNDLFETYSVDVVYNYDRTHENLPDKYHAAIPDLGLEFIFDEKQMFYTLFMKQRTATTFNPFDEADEHLITFDSKSSARNYAKTYGINMTEGNAEFMGEDREWIKFNLPGYSIHYEFVSHRLKLVTLQKGED